MPRWPWQRQAPAERAGQVSLTAAGHRIDVSARAEIRALQKRRQKWQDDGWLFYDEIGEIKYAHNFIGNAFARVRLYVAELPDPENEPLATSDPQAIDALERLADPVVGHGELMRAGAINWQTVGECYLVGVAKPDGTEVWDIRSIDDVEIARDGRGWFVEDPETGEKQRITENDFIARLWRPHARKRRLADSPLRGVLPICEELILLEKAVRAAAKSRGGGRLMFIPDKMSFGPTDPTLAEAGEMDDFDQELLDALITPIQNPDSAEAVVPVIIRGDAEKGKEIRVIDLDRPLDTFLDTRTERALKRLGHGLNLPPEIIEGLAQSNHWNAWLVDDSTFRNHIQGDLEDFLGSMTRAYLWPELIARGIADPRRFFIWYDPSKLIAQPNKGKDADFGVEHLLLSSDAWRQVKGFSEDDAPDQDEIIQRLGIMFGSLDPAQTAAILNRLAGANVVPTESVEVTTDPEEPEETTPPTTRGPPVSSEPGAPIAASIVAAAGRPIGARLSSIDQQFRDRLEGALDTAMRRALDRAGSKIRSRAQRDRSTRASIQNTELDLIAATIGPDAVARLGLEENDLIEGTFEQYESRFLTWAASTQRQALAVARATTEFEDEEAADLESRQASDRSDAWAWLSAALTSLALTRLYNPRPDSGGEGEVDPDATVPYSLVREALARAGGERAIRVIGDAAVSSLGGPLGGIGTGRLILDVLRERGQPVEAWEWEYGTYPRQTFEPHLALDGIVFERFDDARLRNRNAWPRVEFYAPGDHSGCRCDAVPVIVDARLAEPLVASSNGKVVVHA